MPKSRQRRSGGEAGFWLFLDDDLVVTLQHLHPELYFLHAAVLTQAWIGVSIPSAGRERKIDSGMGPVEPWFRVCERRARASDPRASKSHSVSKTSLSKTRATEWGTKLRLPTLTTERAIHISASNLPAAPASKSLPVSGIFFPKYHPEHADSVPRRVSTARATTRIYVNCLNALAHPASGLAAAESLATRLPCFELATANLNEACRGVCQSCRRVDSDRDCQSARLRQTAVHPAIHP